MTKRQNVIPLDMSSPVKALPEPQQIELFTSWFATEGEEDNSRTLAFWDLLPWHLVSRDRSRTLPKAMRFEGVRIDDRCEASVTLTPAIVDDKIIFPGVREELVERALRKMTVQKLATSQLQANPHDNTLAVAIVFSLHQLRQELASANHGFNPVQIREALQVMERCHVAVECQGDAFVHGKNGPILPTLEYIADPKDPNGKRTLYRVTFHPLASAAILGELYHPINYVRVMNLALPLARWITNLLNVRFRYATRGIADKKRSFRLTLQRILSDSGMLPEPRMRDNLDRVRDAIKELQEAGFLERGLALEQIEHLTYEQTGGRRKVVKAEWELFPSDRFAREIIDGNQAKKSRSAGAGSTKKTVV